MTVLAASSHHPQHFARFDFALALSASKFRGIRVSDNQTSSANGRLSRERERESQIGVMGERGEKAVLMFIVLLLPKSEEGEDAPQRFLIQFNVFFSFPFSFHLISFCFTRFFFSHPFFLL